MTDKEAVSAEIARLIGTPVRETSRGGTVKRPFLDDVAAVLGIESGGLSKVDLARTVVESLGQTWDDECASAHTPSGGGGNVTRVGLDRMLAGLRARPALWAAPVDAGRQDAVPDPEPMHLEWRGALDDVARELDAEGHLDVTTIEDERWRTFSAVVQRRGQPRFRRKLLRAYGGRCAVTGCDAVAALEAAHIVPYRGEHTDLATNGLLLRADIHTLFDLGLVGVRVSDRTVVLDEQLTGTVYDDIAGRALRLPQRAVDAPDEAVLRWRAEHIGPAAAAS